MHIRSQNSLSYAVMKMRPRQRQKESERERARKCIYIYIYTHTLYIYKEGKRRISCVQFYQVIINFRANKTTTTKETVVRK